MTDQAPVSRKFGPSDLKTELRAHRYTRTTSLLTFEIDGYRHGGLNE